MSTEHAPGFYWHVHHTILLEWCRSYEERASYIQRVKDESEVPVRLRLMQPVRGTLPEAFVRAWETFDQATKAYGRALRASAEVYRQARLAFVAARQAYEEALAANRPAIEALHAQECPNCPWDGHTIFPSAA